MDFGCRGLRRARRRTCVAATNGPQTFNYAFQVHGNIGVGTALTKSGSYLAGLIGYVALPAPSTGSRYGRAARRCAIVFCRRPGRRMLVALIVFR